MTENVENMIFEILKKIQADALIFRTDTHERLGRLEELARKQRRDTAGLLVMGKALVGNFTEELAAIEERVAVLEARP